MHNSSDPLCEMASVTMSGHGQAAGLTTDVYRLGGGRGGQGPLTTRVMWSVQRDAESGLQVIKTVVTITGDPSIRHL